MFCRYFSILFILTATLLPNAKLYGNVPISDSLQRIINAMPNDTNKVNKMLGLMYFYQNHSHETAVDIGHQALYLSKQIKWLLGKAKINEKIGRVYWSYGQYDSALSYHFIAAWQFNKLNLWKDYWDVIVMIGQDYANSAQYDKALFYLRASLNEYKIKKEEGGVGYVLGILAWVYGAQGDYVNATKNTMEQIKIAEKSKDSNALRFSYFALATNYAGMNKIAEAEKIMDSLFPFLVRNNSLDGLLEYYIKKASYALKRNKIDSAFYYYQKEKEIAKSLKNDYWIADAFSSVGYLFATLHNYKKALLNLDSAYYYFKMGNQTQKLTSINCARTIYLLKLGNIKQAKITINEAEFLKKNLISKTSDLEFFEAKYKYDSAINNWPSAFNYLNLYETLKDSLYNDANTKQILELQIRLETDKREDLLKLQNERTKLFLIILAFITIIIIVFIVLLYLQYKKTKRHNNIQNTMLNEIHHRVKNNLQLISSFMQIQLSKTTDLSGKNALEESINNLNVVSLVHENLYKQSSDFVKLNNYIHNLSSDIHSIIQSNNQYKINIDCQEIKLSIDQTIPIGLIVNELITNTVKHGYKDHDEIQKIINLNITQKAKIIHIHYTDNGIGFNEKEVKNKSTGLKLIKMLVQELNGHYNTNGTNGFEFELSFAIKNQIKNFK
jgi:two-component system, sensor histidine kinase PdtaS